MACTSNLSFVDSQGSTFTYNSIEYGATNVNLEVEGVDTSDQTVDISTLSLTSGCCRQQVPAPLLDCGDTTSDGTLTVQFISTGDTPPTDGDYLLTFAKFSISQQARCTGYSLTAAVGEYVQGSATFDLISP